MDYMKLIEQWKIEEMKAFKGWDFSHLDNRWENEPLCWDYDRFVQKYLKNDSVLLDMGTGGGEYLLSLNHPYDLTYATEAYPPNFELCQNVLSPLGITIKQVFDDTILPFQDETFDIVINRHESFDVSEVKRILKPNGIFITQQVGDKNSKELAKRVLPNNNKIFEPHNLMSNFELLEKYGFRILYKNEEFPKTKFYDIGAFIYFAKIIEWEFPNFSVEACRNELFDLQQQLERNGFIENDEHRFIIIASNES